VNILDVLLSLPNGTGTVNHTGVGGLILGGGFGYLSPKVGLVIDNLISAQLVLADGSIVRASEAEHPDLFWAIRGCGSSFAVCTEFVIQAHDQPNPVFAGMLAFTPDKLESIVAYCNKFHETATDKQALFFGMAHMPPTFQPGFFTVVFYNGPEDEAKEFFADLLALGPVVNMTGMMPYEHVNSMFNAQTQHGASRSTAVAAMKYPFQVELISDIFGTLNKWVAENEGCGATMAMIAEFPYQKVISVP
jgi:FAD/FMN-containing dehydrogenase